MHQTFLHAVNFLTCELMCRHFWRTWCKLKEKFTNTCRNTFLLLKCNENSFCLGTISVTACKESNAKKFECPHFVLLNRRNQYFIKQWKLIDNYKWATSIVYFCLNFVHILNDHLDKYKYYWIVSWCSRTWTISNQMQRIRKSSEYFILNSVEWCSSSLFVRMNIL